MLRYIASVSKIFSKKTEWSFRNKASVKSFDYQNLEQRQLLAGISFDLPSGFVYVDGTSGSDFSFVTPFSSTQVQVSLTGFPTETFLTSQVNRVYFSGMDGDDFINNTTSIPLFAEGGEGNDRLYGSSGNDELLGDIGDDVVSGRDGNDLLWGGAGNDTINAGAGNDVAEGEAGDDLIYGVSGENRLFGGEGNDRIFGGTDNDQIEGGAGNDTISTGLGVNTISGDDGADTLVVSAGATSNILRGGNGNDYINGGNAPSQIFGDAADDRLVGGGFDDDILGGAGNDSISGGAGNDYLEGGEGNDAIVGGDGDDEIVGGADNDRLSGGNGNDRISGDQGADVVNGEVGNDELYGGDDDDFLYGGADDDTIRSGAGNDKAYGQAGNDMMYGQDGNDVVGGGSGDDILFGQEGNDSVIGNDGNDRLYGGNGNDLISGGNGNNGLFGGVSGVKKLVGGPGKDRYLLAETATNELFSFTPSADAQIVFRNGGRAWNDTEISVVDAALHDIHMRAGNTRILKGTFTNQPVVFIKELTVASNRYGKNDLVTIQRVFVNPVTGVVVVRTFQEHQIRLPDWNELDAAANLMVRAEVAHEIAYNWASDAAMTAVDSSLTGIFPRFANLSGWTNVPPHPTLLTEYYRSQDNRWWYFRVAKFTESVATYNPSADFAASFKYYFDSRIVDRTEHQNKMLIIDELFAKLSPLG